MPKTSSKSIFFKVGFTQLIPLVFLLGGCAGSAAPLPKDRATSTKAEIEAQLGITPTDRQMTCGQIAKERTDIAQSTAALEQKIQGNRSRNQVAGYFAYLFLVPVVAIENDTEAKEELSRLQMRRDQLNYLKAEANCP